MSDSQHYPGTAAHQALLEAVVAHYTDDPRVLALSVFGSLGRGNWDEYSDLDLDVVLADEIQVDVQSEVEALCTSFMPLGERILITVPRHHDSADVVLSSLNRFSIRYHDLASTSPNIVKSLQILSGSLSMDAIKAAGLTNRECDQTPVPQYLDRVVRWTIDADAALRRGNFWQAIQLLQSMREELLVLFAVTHGGGRPYHTFDQLAPPELAARLSLTFPVHDLRDAKAVLVSFLALIEIETTVFTNNQATLSIEQREIIKSVRQRVHSLG